MSMSNPTRAEINWLDYYFTMNKIDRDIKELEDKLVELKAIKAKYVWSDEKKQVVLRSESSPIRSTGWKGWDGIK